MERGRKACVIFRKRVPIRANKMCGFPEAGVWSMLGAVWGTAGGPV